MRRRLLFIFLSSVLSLISNDGGRASEPGRILAEQRGCTKCHDPAGRNDKPKAPYLSGQKKKYLISQIEAFQRINSKSRGPFRIAERVHPIMDPLAKSLTNREIALIADYYANLKCISQRTGDVNPMPLPEKAQRCVFCHGPTGINPYLLYPNIGGQKKTYLLTQLHAFRRSALDGIEHAEKEARFHRLMAPSVLDLSDKDIDQISEYFSQQSCR